MRLEESTYGQLYPPQLARAHLTKFVYKKMAVGSILPTKPNDLSIILFRRQCLSEEIKLCYIFEYQCNENRAFRFFGTPGIGTLQDAMNAF